MGRRAGSEIAEEVPRFDASGGLLCQPFVDGHMHLDKTLIGLPFLSAHPGDTIAERIEAEKRIRRELSGPIQARGGRLIEQIVAYGTLGSSQPRQQLGGGPQGPRVGAFAERRAMAILSTSRPSPFRSRALCATPDGGTARRGDAAGADLVSDLDPAGIDNDIDGHLDAISE